MLTTQLPILFCLLVDFPQNNIDCDRYDESNCFECKKPGKYLFSKHDTAPIACFVLWICIVITGVFGTCANGFVISVLRKRNKPTSFDFLLYVLASFDLINSLATLVSGTGIIFYLENVDQGLFTLMYYYVSILLFFFGKSGSAFMTVFITVERYLVIANPVKSRVWFTPRRIKIMTFGLIMLATLFNIPRFSSIIPTPNNYGQNVPSIEYKEYMISSTPLEEFWYRNLKSVHYVDCFAPFPLLIIFNVLLFFKISKFVRNRQQLTNKQKSDIRAARMFIPVVVVLFLCNIIPIAYYIMISLYNVSYRELFFGMLLSVAINSAANLPIYYARGGSFRTELRNNLPEFIKSWFGKVPEKNSTEMVASSMEQTGTTVTVTSTSDCEQEQDELEDYFLPVGFF